MHRNAPRANSAERHSSARKTRKRRKVVRKCGTWSWFEEILFRSYLSSTVFICITKLLHGASKSTRGIHRIFRHYHSRPACIWLFCVCFFCTRKLCETVRACVSVVFIHSVLVGIVVTRLIGTFNPWRSSLKFVPRYGIRLKRIEEIVWNNMSWCITY